MNTDGLSYLSPKDYFRDYNDENLSSVLEAIVGKYGKKILLEEDLLKQELKAGGVSSMDIYKLLLISKCRGFSAMIAEESISSVVDLDRLTNNIFTQTRLNREDVMRLAAAVFIALGMIEVPGIKHIVEKTLENIGSKHYTDDGLRSSAFTLETSQYQSRTLEHFEQVFENNRADVDSITEVDLRNLEALLINGVPKAKYYTACYIMSRIGSKGVAERSERAISLLNQAADEGDAQAAAKLADYYYEGRHHDDHDRAYKLYTGIGALALDEKRRENMLGLFNQKLYYNKLLKFTAVLYALFTLSMVIPFGLGSYKNLTLLGILFSLISLGVLISGFVINKIKPYFNIQFIPATLFIVWFFDILIRLVR
ncbi:MAG: sel1 repeat family protein [Lachnospiraceae bacterium]|nr:MAG: sel1 repeat family protein [Lachnospiraceae bacterium]